ncbi:MAG: META domain-containing protein [Muribaculaceae bacterium]|nr:META domain-containing protein [Muribaculaceae bacterium]
MKKTAFLIPLIALTLLSCTGKRNETRTEEFRGINSVDSVKNVDILGQWYIENIFFNDSCYVKPNEEVLGSRQYILFEQNGNYAVMTNCNHGAGKFTLKGTYISFSDAAWTELACENMTTEEAVRKILPQLNSVEIENDSVMRINSSSEPYLILTKAKEIK